MQGITYTVHVDEEMHLILREDRVYRIIILFHAVGGGRSAKARSGLTVLLLVYPLARSDMLGLRLPFAAARSSRVVSTRRVYRPVRPTALRMFSTTLRLQSAEVPDDFIHSIKNTALFQKLADKPNALKALSDLYALTKEMGAFVTSISFLVARSYTVTSRGLFLFFCALAFTLQRHRH
jgi:hypothetical protein